MLILSNVLQVKELEILCLRYTGELHLQAGSMVQL